MINNLLLQKKSRWLIFMAIAIMIVSLLSFKSQQPKQGIVKITFINTANGKPIVLIDSMYSNFFGEQYSINKLKYYISDFRVAGATQQPEADSYHLINAREEVNAFEISLDAGQYNGISFLLGVDSTNNCSGAQSGALDPMNDMFWTWNSGYVMFKLEGTSSSSTADLQRIEHHIGGFKGDKSVVTLIKLDIPQKLIIKEDVVTELIIETNLDNYWKNASEIKISELPLCTTTGEIAKKIAANFTGLFSIRKINY